MEEVKRGRGRPTVGERVPLGLRVTPEMKEKLDAAALLSGRSQSQEAEFRIEHSFDREDLLPDVLNIAYGNKRIANLVMTLGAVFLVAGEAVASDSKMRERLKSRDWTSDPAVCDIAIEAAHTVLESFRPAGAIPWKDAGLGVHAANISIKKSGREQMREVPKDVMSARLKEIAGRLDIGRLRAAAATTTTGPVEHQAPLEKGMVLEFRRRA